MHFTFIGMSLWFFAGGHKNFCYLGILMYISFITSSCSFNEGLSLKTSRQEFHPFLCVHAYQEKLIIWIIFSIWSHIPFFLFVFSEVNETNYSPGAGQLSWSWTAWKRKRVAEVLVMEAMSSEESCYEDDDINTSKVTKYSVHRLQWESRRMKKLKKKLDKAYKKKLTSTAKERILPRVDGQPSLRCSSTENFLEWAIMQ